LVNKKIQDGGNAMGHGRKMFGKGKVGATLNVALKEAGRLH